MPAVHQRPPAGQQRPRSTCRTNAETPRSEDRGALWLSAREPIIFEVGVAGFEPATSCSRSGLGVRGSPWNHAYRVTRSAAKCTRRHGVAAQCRDGGVRWLRSRSWSCRPIEPSGSTAPQSVASERPLQGRVDSTVTVFIDFPTQFVAMLVGGKLDAVVDGAVRIRVP